MPIHICIHTSIHARFIVVFRGCYCNALEFCVYRCKYIYTQACRIREVAKKKHNIKTKKEKEKKQRKRKERNSNIDG